MDTVEARLAHVRLELLRGKTWRYLRYRHAREAVRLIAPDASVLVIGGGHALAEVALALEFPDMRFHVTDHAGASHTVERSRRLIARYEISNISFGELDILKPDGTAQHDLVYSVEVLEHIAEDARAAENMRRLARGHVFTLVPFAEDAINDDPAWRKRAREAAEHERVGYDAKRLIGLFPDPVALRGCYWADAGLVLRRRLTDMSGDEIAAAATDLEAQGAEDLRPLIPTTIRAAAGIWILSKA